jgi:hypothetical protein
MDMRGICWTIAGVYRIVGTSYKPDAGQHVHSEQDREDRPNDTCRAEQCSVVPSEGLLAHVECHPAGDTN